MEGMYCGTEGVEVKPSENMSLEVSDGIFFVIYSSYYLGLIVNLEIHMDLINLKGGVGCVVE